MKYLPFLFLYAALFSSIAYAEEKTFEESIPLAIKDRRDQFITLTLENDSLGSGRDRNYTHGTRLTYFDSDLMPQKIGEAVSSLVPSFDLTHHSYAYFSLGQNLYTPRDITATTPDPNDRPYAGFLYGAVGFDTVRDNHIDGVEVTLGVVGPAALGENVQVAVHDFIDTRDPSGWDHQLHNEPAFMIAAQRLWPDFYTAERNDLFLRFSPHAGASVGNIYTYGAAGATVQLLPKNNKWQAPPLRVRPAIPGSGYFSVPENKFSWSLFSGVEGRLMGRNIFLDGNSFRSSPSVDKKDFVLDANAGVSFTYGKTQLSYTLNWRSKEFRGQSDDSLFGAVSISRRF